MKNLYVCLFLLFINCVGYSQDSIQAKVADLKAKIDKMENKVVTFGISIGYKRIWNKDINDFQSASISPIDSTLHLESLDNGSVVLSTELMITPFNNSKGIKDLIEKAENKLEPGSQSKKFFPLISEVFLLGLQKFTFIASVNLAEFQTAQNNYSFNKSIDGGLGIGLKLSENFWLAWTYEIATHRKLRSNIESFENQKITIDGETLTSLDESDNSLFYDKKLSSSNFKFIIKF